MPTRRWPVRLSSTALLVALLGFSSCFEDCNPSPGPTAPSEKSSAARVAPRTPDGPAGAAPASRS